MTEDSEKVDLEKLIEEDKFDKAKESESLSKQDNKKKRKKTALISTVSVIGAALVVTLIVYDPFTNSLRWSHSSKTVDVYNDTATNQSVYDPYAWAKKSGQIFPVPTEKWEETSYMSDSQVGTLKQKQNKYWNTDLRQASLVLPSESNGFTSDDSKAFDENGNPNPLYSYWTQEVFYNETTDLLEKLLNPVYGTWTSLQYPEGMSSAKETLNIIFQNYFTPEALKKGVPVFADWNEDNYGMGDELLSGDEGYRWIGEITSMTTNFTYDNDTNQYTVILTANVTYSAWTKDKGTVTKDGVLTLKLESNVDNKVNSDNKVIVESASLDMK